MPVTIIEDDLLDSQNIIPDRPQMVLHLLVGNFYLPKQLQYLNAEQQPRRHQLRFLLSHVPVWVFPSRVPACASSLSFFFFFILLANL